MMTHLLTKSLRKKTEYIGLIEENEDNDVDDEKRRASISKENKRHIILIRPNKRQDGHMWLDLAKYDFKNVV